MQNEKGTPVISATVIIDDPDEDIFLGVDAKVKIYAASAKNVVTLPVEVVNIGKEGSFCYVIEDGLVTKRNITTGISSEDYVEITDGIKEGEEVMPRKGPAPKRPLVDDPVYGSKIVTQLVNRVLLDGKKTVSERIVYGALEMVRERTEQEPVSVLKRALDNIRPALEVRSRRVGGATYQVPVEVRPARATTLALRWLVDFSRQRREKTMTERLANEILDASNGLGAAVKRREDMHKMAESNRAFAHYRW